MVYCLNVYDDAVLWNSRSAPVSMTRIKSRHTGRPVPMTAMGPRLRRQGRASKTCKRTRLTPRLAVVAVLRGKLSAINLFFALEILELGQPHIGKSAGWLAVFRCSRNRRSGRVLKKNGSAGSASAMLEILARQRQTASKYTNRNSTTSGAATALPRPPRDGVRGILEERPDLCPDDLRACATCAQREPLRNASRKFACPLAARCYRPAASGRTGSMPGIILSERPADLWTKRSGTSQSKFR